MVVCFGLPLNKKHPKRGARFLETSLIDRWPDRSLKQALSLEMLRRFLPGARVDVSGLATSGTCERTWQFPFAERHIWLWVKNRYPKYPKMEP